MKCQCFPSQGGSVHVLSHAVSSLSTLCSNVVPLLKFSEFYKTLKERVHKYFKDNNIVS